VLDYLECPDVGLAFVADAYRYYAKHGKPQTRAVAGNAQGSGPNDAQQTDSKKEDSSAPVSRVESKPATEGRIKTSQSEAGLFIAFLLFHARCLSAR
jgi:hypothetical protein